MLKHKYIIFCALWAIWCLTGLCTEKADAQCSGINFTTTGKTKSCPLLIVKFNATGTSSAAGTKFEWDFGNGFGKGMDTITEAFSAPGQYTIKMQATLSGSNTPCPVVQKDTYITVLPYVAPTMKISTGFTDCNFIKNKKIIFTDITPDVVSRNWIINGVSDTAKNFTDSFQTTGDYVISLSTKNKYGCPGFTYDTLHLLDSIPVDICASFTVSKSGTVGTFTPGVGSTQGATIISYKWAFPGGSPSSSNKEFPPNISYPDITKKYDVSLTITSSTGCTYTILRKGFVSPFLTPLFQKVCATGYYVYTDVSDGKRVGYNFNFPNGNFTPLPTMGPPTYGYLDYNAGGTYDASISYYYSPGLGCPISVSYHNFVTALGPRVGFSSDDNQICNPYDTVHFTNLSDTTNSSNVQYTWLIFDSTDKKLLKTNNKIGPTYNYDTFYIPGKVGKFGVELIAKSPNGCIDSVNTPNFIISAKPKADFDSLKNPYYCIGSSVSLLSKVTPPEGTTFNYKYKWKVYNQASISPPDSGIAANFTYSADSLGTFDVYMSVSNGHCSSDTFKKGFFNVIGDLVKTVKVGASAGCLNPDFSTTISIGRQEIFPIGSKTFYHWYLDPNSGLGAFVKFANPDSPATRVTFTHDGCYPMYVTIRTVVNDTDTCTKVFPPSGGAGVSVCVGPALSFGVGLLKCPGDTVDVTNYSQKGDYGYKWHVVPDSDAVILPSDTATNPRIVFKKDTCYYVILQGSRTINGTTCSDIDTSYQCFHLPKPGFYSPTPTLYCAPASATFVNTTQNYAYASGYIWRFDDGDSLVVNDTNRVSHVYFRFNKGAYNISLTALNQYGCDATVKLKTSVNIIGPVPLFTVDKKVGCDSLTVNFTNTSKNVKKPFFIYGYGSNTTTNPNIPPLKYILDDPTKDSVIYIPTLASLDDTVNCKSDYFTDTIKLYRTPIDAIVTSDKKVGCNPLKVQFFAVSRPGNTWKWDFDDDGIIDDSIHQNPYFVYRKPGKYRARLIITNHGHCPYTVYSDTIDVAPNAVPGFIPSQKTFCGQQAVSFRNTSLYTVKYAFNYGDGSPTDSNNLTVHKYYYDTRHDTGIAAYFYPRMIAFNAGGCSDTLIDTLTVYRLPVAGFAYSKPTGCAPLKVSFTDTSKNDYAAEWDFDNDGIFDAFGKHVEWVYGSGLYTVKMRAYNLQGCVDSIIKVNLVVANTTPVADFIVSDSDVCYRDSVKFTNTTVPSDSVVSWSWNFNDPAAPFDTSSAKNPSFRFYQKGWHTVTLKAIDNQGCTSFISKRAVFVEDTFPPKNTNLLYVSVMDSNSIKLVYNKSNLQHFAAYKLNWISNGIPMKSDTVTSVNDTMFTFTDTAFHTSASSYCFSIQTLNQCRKVSFGSFVHCSVVLSGTALAGPSNLLNWTAYSGWAPGWYYIYRSENGGVYKKIDSVRGNILTWTDTSLCDEKYGYYVAAKNDSSRFLSNSNSVTIKARYVHDNSPMNLHYATVLNNSVVKLSWDNSTYKGLAGYQVSRYSANTGWVANFAATGSNSYIDNRALINDSSYTYTVRTIDKCGYLGPVSNDGTSILIKAKVAYDKVNLNWNSYRNWPAGVQYYQVQVQLNNKKFKNVARVPGTDSSYVDDSVYNEIDTAYCYRVIAVENGPVQDSSISNLSCAVLPSRVFVPNAFSPNGDSLNDVWKVSSLSIYNVVGSKLTQFSAKVYNRWGMLVFESNDIYKGWDGTFKGTKAPADVYIYIVYAEGIDSRFIRLNGNITLIR